jgi:hypothetical protein
MGGDSITDSIIRSIIADIYIISVIADISCISGGGGAMGRKTQSKKGSPKL